MSEVKRHPDFFIVGAGKAGTTALWRYLSNHPQVFMTKDIRHKELAFYSDHYGISEESKYLSFFDDAHPNQLIGESCHTYITSPESPERIFKNLPSAKIIIMLRDPVKRSYSLYNWMVMFGYEKLKSYKLATDAEASRMNNPVFIKWATPFYFRNFFYKNSSLYFKQVQEYKKLFGDNCRVYFFEEFNKDPEAVLKDICNLLEIEYNPSVSLTRENESKIPRSIKLQFYLRNDLQWKLTKLGFSQKKASAIIEFFIRMNTSRKKPKKLDQASYDQFRTFFENDIKDLSELLNKDLNLIWKY